MSSTLTASRRGMRMPHESKPFSAARGNRTIPQKEKAGIVLVDDHPLVREGIASLIDAEADMQVVGQAGSVGEGLALIDQLRPAMVMIDINLPDGGGLEMTKGIKARFKSVKVLIFSLHAEGLYARRALQAGAAGYLNKSSSATEISRAIRQVLGGHVYLSKLSTDLCLSRFVGNEAATAADPLEALTDRELSIFELLGQGLGSQQIGDRLHLSVKTIETYRQNLKHKLGVTANPELIRQAIQWQMERR
ncbi:MAG: response regulator transcription factor [Planctomycetota bacterium]|nr:response regulator transcription factor [Planctomycetota bacterium]